MEILVNGDDFGKNENVTKAIAHCFKKGILSSTTLMTNMPYADEAVEIARKEGFFHKVGIHLNLTEGFPLTKEIQGSSLFCNQNGEFHGNFHRSTKYRLFMGRREREMAALELAAQLQKYKEYGLSMGHLDSHHHIHTNKPILDVMIPLLEYPIIVPLRYIFFNPVYSILNPVPNSRRALIFPFTSTVPQRGFNTPVIIFNNVDLPDPLVPIIPTHSPLRISK